MNENYDETLESLAHHPVLAACTIPQGAVKSLRLAWLPLLRIRTAGFPTLLWGNSIALSWTWGLGLFFSVQFTTQFGLFGLLTFAIPNAIGLLAFGLVTHHIARREKGSESLATFFTNWSRPFRLVFFLYQLLAITLTIFAFIRYGWQTLGYEPWILYMPLTLLIVPGRGDPFR